MMASGARVWTPVTAPWTLWMPIPASQRRAAEDLVDALAVRADVELEHAGPLDRVVVASLRLAVGPQQLELAGHLRRGEQVARVGVAGDQAQRLPLAHPPDHQRRVGAA